MSRKFVVSLDGNPGLRDPITEYFLGKRWRVWHWHADLWLIAGVEDDVDAARLHQDLEAAVPLAKTVPMVVIEQKGEAPYFGRAFKQETWDWMASNWGTAERRRPDE